MENFSWTNADVMEKLQQLKNKEVRVGDAVYYFKQQYNYTCAIRTIYYHTPKEVTADSYLTKEDVLPLKTKFGNQMPTVREKTNYRLYRKQKEGRYVCIDCEEALSPPIPLPALLETIGRYTLNEGFHANECRVHPINKLIARDIDSAMREEAEKNSLMRPQEAHERGQHHALKLAKDAGQTGKEKDSIAILFPSWHDVRNQWPEE